MYNVTCIAYSAAISYGKHVHFERYCQKGISFSAISSLFTYNMMYLRLTYFLLFNPLWRFKAFLFIVSK